MSTAYLLDANVLVALVAQHHVHHAAAHAWFRTVDSWVAGLMPSAQACHSSRAV